MTPEERKEYYKKYYAVNRETILGNLSKKVKCANCSRIISLSYLAPHLKSKLCEKYGKIKFI